MLSCKEVSKFVSESLDHKLPLWTRVSLWMHLCMCRLCWGFRKDLIHIHGETREIADRVEDEKGEPDARLSAEARERIKRLLASQQP